MLPKYKGGGGGVSINNNEIRNKPDHFYEVLVSILNFLVFMRNSPHWRT